MESHPDSQSIHLTTLSKEDKKAFKGKGDSHGRGRTRSISSCERLTGTLQSLFQLSNHLLLYRTTTDKVIYFLSRRYLTIGKAEPNQDVKLHKNSRRHHLTARLQQWQQVLAVGWFWKINKLASAASRDEEFVYI